MMEPMDCQTCEDLLMDVLYEELDEVRTAAVRKHLEGCASCKASWGRVSGGRSLAASLVPPEAPPVNDALRAAIHAAAERYSAPPVSVPVAANDRGVAPVIPIESAPRRIPGWLRRVGEVAMRRQVAMVAISLLTVGVGLRMLPFQSPTRATGTESVTAPEVVPATELPPPEVAHPSTEMPRNEGMLQRHAAHQGPERRPSTPGGTPGLATPTPATNPFHEAQTVTAQPAAPNSVNGANDMGNVARDGRLGSPAAYRTVAPHREDLAARALNVPTQTHAGSTSAGDFERVLPTAPGSNAQHAQGEPAWRVLQRSAEDQRAHGNQDGAIAAYRQALAQNPPENERQSMNQALYLTLVRANRTVEANELRATQMRRLPETGSLDNEVPAPSVWNAPSSTRPSSVARPAPSPAMPVTTHPARRSSNAAQDTTNQMAY